MAEADFQCEECGAVWSSRTAADMCAWRDDEADRTAMLRRRHRHDD